jgi:hypothetical protein
LSREENLVSQARVGVHVHHARQDPQSRVEVLKRDDMASLGHKGVKKTGSDVVIITHTAYRPSKTVFGVRPK